MNFSRPTKLVLLHFLTNAVHIQSAFLKHLLDKQTSILEGAGHSRTHKSYNLVLTQRNWSSTFDQKSWAVQDAMQEYS